MLCSPTIDGGTAADDVLHLPASLRHWQMLFGAVLRWVPVDDKESK